MNYWMVKQEPEAYSFDDLVKDKKTEWTGVRNYQARNNLATMKKGDPVLFYHSISDKAVVGIAEVSKAAFADPTDEKWTAVEIKAIGKFKNPVTLEKVKAEPKLANILLVRNGRISVMPLTKAEYEKIVSMSK
jgi:Uncharacterized conserved protein